MNVVDELPTVARNVEELNGAQSAQRTLSKLCENKNLVSKNEELHKFSLAPAVVTLTADLFHSADKTLRYGDS